MRHGDPSSRVEPSQHPCIPSSHLAKERDGTGIGPGLTLGLLCLVDLLVVPHCLLILLCVHVAEGTGGRQAQSGSPRDGQPLPRPHPKILHRAGPTWPPTGPSADMVAQSPKLHTQPHHPQAYESHSSKAGCTRTSPSGTVRCLHIPFPDWVNPAHGTRCLQPPLCFTAWAAKFL